MSISSDMPIRHVEPGEMEQVAASDLFDAVYYQTHYRHALLRDGYQDPLRHFCELGVERGYLPSPRIDPVVQRLLRPGIGRRNPLLNALEQGLANLPEGGILALFPTIHGLREDLDSSTDNFDRSDIEEQRRNQAYASEIAAARRIPFQVDEASYEIQVPEASDWLARMAQGRPFAYVRLPHGFWDSVYRVERVARFLADQPICQGLTADERYSLAVRLCAAIHPWNSNFIESFQEEVLLDAARHVPHADFFRGISFKGTPTWREGLFNLRTVTESHLERPRLFARTIAPGETLIDAMLPKRWIISGDAARLPEITRDHAVLLIANDRYGDLDQRWGLRAFHWLRIEQDFSQLLRWRLLEQSLAILSELRRQGHERIYVFTQCGAALAYWLIDRLFQAEPDVFYFDLGQAIKGWFMDRIWLNGERKSFLLDKDAYPCSMLEIFQQNIQAWAGEAVAGDHDGNFLPCSNELACLRMPMLEQMGLLKEAVALAGKGRLSDAESHCLRLIDGEQGIAAKAAHLLSLLAEARGNMSQALVYADVAASRVEADIYRQRLHDLRARR